VAFSWSKFRVRSAWLFAVPFFWFARPYPLVLAVGGVLALVGLAIRGWAAGTIHKNQELTTTGPYAFTRNPLYVGSSLIGCGVAIAGGQWVWLAVFVVLFGAVYRRTIQRETSNLTKLFPERYARYAAAVPVFLPRLRPYRDAGQGAPASGGFGWPQYFHNREWEAAFGVSAAFALLIAKATLL
jgi:protein-S-isoprenylcysteine O-methyltransferase Ste14